MTDHCFYAILFSFILIEFVTTRTHPFPQILTETQNQTANLSSTISLTCHIVNLTDHHVTWFKTDPLTSATSPLAVGKQLFTTDPRYSISFYSTSLQDSFWSLDIYQVQLTDQGIYTCRIANRRASVDVSIHLHVQLPMSLTPTELNVEPGNPIHLNCTIFLANQSFSSSSLLSALTWDHSSNSLNQSHFRDVQIRRTFFDQMFISYLTIDHAQVHHSGLWTCIFHNQYVTSKVLVQKDVFHRQQQQRTGALLSNEADRLYISLYLFVFLFGLLDKYS